ncbi:hypothetical protein ACOTWK_00125 [Aliarcobacter butzleri]|uniref:hypothetical protein n=1 Tax=Aliarcobacter butzleri TaxID=28197 RepID=UPI003AED2D0C
MEFFKNKGFLEASITILVSIIGGLSVAVFDGYSVKNISELFDEYFKLGILVFFAILVFILIIIKAKEEVQKEQENEERIRNIIKEELENLTLKNNPIKTTEKVDEKGEK